MKKQKYVSKRDSFIRLIIIVGSIFSFFIAVVPPAAMNVANCSVYYAHQASKGENHDLELQMLIDHLWWMTVPEDP